jgi:hypothetical protein
VKVRESRPRCFGRIGFVFLIVHIPILVGCGPDNSSQSRIAALESDNRDLRLQIDRLKAERDDLQGKLSVLRESDQGLWSQALEQEQAGLLTQAIATLEQLTKRFPNSQLRTQAEEKVQAIRQEAARRERIFEEAFKKLEAEVANAADSLQAVLAIERFKQQNSPPSADTAAKVEKIEQEQRVAAREALAFKNAAESAGIDISDLRAYWTVDPNVLGGRELLVPYVRFSVKNISSSPITSLKFVGSFKLTEKSEILGDGSQYTIGYGDPPLPPGYSKEVFFGSSTGYTGYAAYSKRPPVTVDLYSEVNKNPRALVRCLRVPDVIR